jgi:hypothetical protein
MEAMRIRFSLGVVAVASTFLLTPLIATVGESPAFAKEKKAAPKKKPGVRKRSTPPATKKAAAKKTPAPAAAPAAEAKPVESDLVPASDLRGPTRLDFDDRLIQGQTNKSGAVYLFDRKETGISSMVRRRKTFRQLTLRTIYDR